MANVADLQSKYSKLAQEYSKLRAQNQVLKKAVVDEQTASCSLKVLIIHTHADCSIHDIFHLLNLTKPLCTY
uniref:Protein phosphatase 1 regulatory subunit 21-like n=1 Tax=Sinocyclocheilus grahami TaxID=75366 RepID=A0A672K770_SINGR